MKIDRSGMLTLFLLISFAFTGCIQPEPKRTILPKDKSIAVGPYLEQVQQGAMAISIIESVLSIPGVFDEAPSSIAKPLKQTVNAMRYFAKPQVIRQEESDYLQAKTLKDKESQDTPELTLNGWFAQGESSPYMTKLGFRAVDASGQNQFTVLEDSAEHERVIHFLEIFKLFEAISQDGENQPKMISGAASYRADKPGAIQVKAKDLEFLVKAQKVRISFTMVVNERNGSIVNGEISGKLVDPKTNNITSEYNWDLETIIKNAKNWPVYQEKIGAGT